MGGCPQSLCSDLNAEAGILACVCVKYSAMLSVLPTRILQKLSCSANNTYIHIVLLVYLSQQKPKICHSSNNQIQSNLPILVTLGPDTFGLSKEVVAIQMTLINRSAELFNIIDHIINVSI